MAKTSVLFALFCAGILASSPALAEYPRLDTTDKGGRLGIAFNDQDTFNKDGYTCLSVITVYPQSTLYGVLQPGDCVYSVNGFLLRNIDDVFAVSSSGSPGASVQLYFFDSSDSYLKKTYAAKVVDSSVFPTVSTTPASYPLKEYPDAGGRLGVGLDHSTIYTNEGKTCVKITKVFTGSNLSGVLQSGDCIYGVNGFDLRDAHDLNNVVFSGAPGSTSNLTFFDASDGYLAKKYSVKTVSASVHDDTPVTVASSTAPPRSYCDEHPILCIGGIIITGAVVLKALSDQSGNSSSDDGYTGNNSAGSTQRQRQTYDAPSDNTPPPDTSVGCGWGDTIYNTCH